ncbi:hypothetical protein ElyMa_005997600 [Elysia marginata]|uniref:Uncharacterized protein n=1 Tax=Elysia marginata TaxID=1093978 RepID=A0AAV4GF96_9GAST|nr:hypothetical protein ElyMa_005997600 [Elysia marginata]
MVSTHVPFVAGMNLIESEAEFNASLLPRATQPAARKPGGERSRASENRLLAEIGSGETDTNPISVALSPAGSGITSLATRRGRTGG